jgi:hypothetical protein
MLLLVGCIAIVPDFTDVNVDKWNRDISTACDLVAFRPSKTPEPQFLRCICHNNGSYSLSALSVLRGHAASSDLRGKSWFTGLRDRDFND